MQSVARTAAAALSPRTSALPSLPLAASACASRGYHKNVVDHYENPRNVGSFDKNDINVGTGAPLFELLGISSRNPTLHAPPSSPSPPPPTSFSTLPSFLSTTTTTSGYSHQHHEPCAYELPPLAAVRAQLPDPSTLSLWTQHSRDWEGSCLLPFSEIQVPAWFQQGVDFGSLGKEGLADLPPSPKASWGHPLAEMS